MKMELTSLLNYKNYFKSYFLSNSKKELLENCIVFSLVVLAMTHVLSFFYETVFLPALAGMRVNKQCKLLFHKNCIRSNNPKNYWFGLALLLGVFSYSLYAEADIRRIALHDSTLIYDLDTKWKFATGNFPEAAIPNYKDSHWKYLPVPGLWSNYDLLGNRHAWYRLQLDIGPDFANKKMGIIVPGIFEGYKLFFNGHLIGSDGETDENGNLIKSTNKINFYAIDPSFIYFEQPNTIALHVLDQYNFGGITDSFFIGRYELVKSKFFLYFLRTAALNGSFIVLGIIIFFATIGKKELRIFSIFALISFFSGFSILFLKRISGWFFTDFQLLHYSFFIPQAVLPVLYIHATNLFFGYKLNLVGRFLTYCFIPIFMLTILSGINTDFLQLRNSLFEPILTSYSFITVLYIVYLLVIAFLTQKMIGLKYILLGSLGLAIVVIGAFIKHYIGTTGEYYLSEAFFVFFLFLLYAVFKQFQAKLQTAKDLEENYRKNLEKEIIKKTHTLNEFNKELQAANKIKDKLFSIIGHDLRSPLDALNIILSLFQDEKLTLEQFRIHIQKLINVLAQNRILLENLLEWASLQIGYYKVFVTEFDMVLLSKEVLELLTHIANQKNIQLQISVNGTLMLKSDRNIIVMVLNNLVNNAIKFTYPSGSVEICLYETETYVSISVIDTGIGLPVDEEIFMDSINDYTRPGTNMEKSTGIGLNLCKSFLKKIQSELFYEKNPGGGSIFSFYIQK